MSRLPAGTEPVYTLVTVTYAGRTWRFSTEELDIDTDDGEVRYVAALGAIMLSEGADLPNVSLEILWPEPVADLVAAGHDLGTAWAEVARWRYGTTYERRRVVTFGTFRSPEYGDEAEVVATTISTVLEDTSTIPEPTAAATSRTWNQTYIAASDVDRVYPTVIGSPGVDPSSSTGVVSGSQVVWGSIDRYWKVAILAGHPVGATQVRLASDGDATGELVNVRHVADGLGRVCAVVDYHADEYYGGGANDLGVDLNPEADNEISVYAGWPSGETGLAGPDGEPLRRAGDVLAWALGQIRGVSVDAGRTAAAAALLRDYFIDGVIDASTTAHDWVTAALLPILPVSIVHGSRGLHPVVWRWQATAADAVATLDADADPEIVRVSRVRVNTDKIANDITVAYGRSLRVGRYMREARRGVFDEEYATVIVEGYNGDRIRVTATTYGTRGADILVSLAEDPGFSVVEDVEAKTVDVFFDGAATAQDVIDEINSVCTSIRAELYAGLGSNVIPHHPSDIYARDYRTMLVRTDGATGDPRCVASQVRYGKRTLRLETAYCYDDGTANRIAADLVAQFAAPIRTVDYLLPEGGWYWLERGAVVVVNDETVALAGALALVWDVQAGDTDHIGVTLRLL